MLVASIESFSDKGELRRLRVFGPSIVHPRNSNSKLFEHFIEFTIYYARMGDEDVVEIGFQVRFEAENALANAPFDPVPPCVTPDLLGGRDPSLPSPRSATMRKLAVDTRFPDLKMASNFGLLSPFLGRDLVSTLRSASLQSVLAISRAHADAEPVRLLSMAVIWLVGPFHSSNSS